MAALVCVALSICVFAAERAWQTGKWKEVQAKRPKVVFGVAPNDPGTGAPRSSPPAAQETRTYTIETDAEVYEFKENTTVDAPRIEVLLGEPVQFAIEKKNIWIKDKENKEHRFSLSKVTKK